MFYCNLGFIGGVDGVCCFIWHGCWLIICISGFGFGFRFFGGFAFCWVLICCFCLFRFDWCFRASGALLFVWFVWWILVWGDVVSVFWCIWVLVWVRVVLIAALLVCYDLFVVGLSFGLVRISLLVILPFVCLICRLLFFVCGLGYCMFVVVVTVLDFLVVCVLVLSVYDALRLLLLFDWIWVCWFMFVVADDGVYLCIVIFVSA